jgi:hypothetical protein
MTSLPLSFRVKNAVVEKHQLEGIDPSDRYFNRLIPIKRVEGGYNGSVMYEALTLDSQVHRTVPETTKDIDCRSTPRLRFHQNAHPPQFQRPKIPRRKRNLGRVS